jgi:hypothetical protein
VVQIIKVVPERAKVYGKSYGVNKKYRYVGLYGILQKASAVLQESVS